MRVNFVFGIWIPLDNNCFSAWMKIYMSQEEKDVNIKYTEVKDTY